MSRPRIVVGIDPGLESTALVVFTDGRITDACTFTTKARGPRPDFASVIERGSSQAQRVVEALSEIEHVDAVAIEEYEDFGGGHLRTRNNKPIPLRWTTPAVCALIGAQVDALGYAVTWQRPSLVMAHYREYKARWAAKQFGIVPGDELLTNDHTRSAACHALAWIAANRTERSTT